MDSQEIPIADSSLSPVIQAVESAAIEDSEHHSPPPSDDDDHHPQPVVASSDEDLRARIIKQVEFYFSDANLPSDKFLLKQVKKDKEGFISISLIASFRKMKKLTKDSSLIVDALKESSQLVVSSDGKKVKRLHPLPINVGTDPKLRTVVLENLPDDNSLENIQKICARVGSVKNVSIHDPHGAVNLGKSSKTKKVVSSKVYALVEYETLEAAEKAVATLNDETDWRNGLRVQLLQSCKGPAFGRKVWREVDSDKSGNARVTVSTKDEGKKHSTEHHDDALDDKDGENTSKERIARKGRNHSKGRKYHGNNGMGHGIVSVEISKPPPGPRMPDGTRGFTMGRGRPPVSSHV
ncbi:unnamed protein product [Amaranthus hypochondriacus]